MSLQVLHLLQPISHNPSAPSSNHITYPIQKLISLKPLTALQVAANESSSDNSVSGAHEEILEEALKPSDNDEGDEIGGGLTEAYVDWGRSAERWLSNCITTLTAPGGVKPMELQPRATRPLAEASQQQGGPESVPPVDLAAPDSMFMCAYLQPGEAYETCITHSMMIKQLFPNIAADTSLKHFLQTAV
ncbi:hypothetical protein DFH08DRAFT_818366 [Mycena albidolilacea]|uniref:Uncharacterized protein n=1 Tax=Mycena albidolilacea TaxID=1033008 RepID=A0AAD6ZH16_9AGAR|nr:hypothetical protein DFH08DRAFT_818366 [Mycena albidolilacea]